MREGRGVGDQGEAGLIEAVLRARKLTTSRHGDTCLEISWLILLFPPCHNISLLPYCSNAKITNIEILYFTLTFLFLGSHTTQEAARRQCAWRAREGRRCSAAGCRLVLRQPLDRLWQCCRWMLRHCRALHCLFTLHCPHNSLHCHWWWFYGEIIGWSHVFTHSQAYNSR